MNEESKIEIARIKDLLKKVVWDYHLDEDTQYRIFIGEIIHPSVSQEDLKAKLLNGYSWHTLINVFGFETVAEFLEENIIKKIYPQSYRNNILNAKRILSR